MFEDVIEFLKDKQESPQYAEAIEALEKLQKMGRASYYMWKNNIKGNIVTITSEGFIYRSNNKDYNVKWDKMQNFI